MFISTLNYQRASVSINSPLDILRFDERTEEEEGEEKVKYIWWIRIKKNMKISTWKCIYIAQTVKIINGYASLNGCNLSISFSSLWRKKVLTTRPAYLCCVCVASSKFTIAYVHHSNVGISEPAQASINWMYFEALNKNFSSHKFKALL